LAVNTPASHPRLRLRRLLPSSIRGFACLSPTAWEKGRRGIFINPRRQVLHIQIGVSAQRKSGLCAEARVEGVAERVAEEVEGHDGQAERQAGREQQEGMLLHVGQRF
jgi:hypothetical protein